MTTTRSLRVALSVCLLAAPLATLAAQAHGDASGGTGLYVSAAYGVTLPADLKTIDKDKIEETIKTDWGFLGGQVGLGFHLFGFRPELAVGYRQAAIEDSDGNHSVTSVDVIASVYLDVGIAGPVVLYVGVGGGMSNVTVKEGEDKPVWAPAFQGAAGIGFVLGDLALTLGYRARGTTDAPFLDTDTDELLKMSLTHNAEVGLRYSF